MLSSLSTGDSTMRRGMRVQWDPDTCLVHHFVLLHKDENGAGGKKKQEKEKTKAHDMRHGNKREAKVLIPEHFLIPHTFPASGQIPTQHSHP